MILTMHSLLLRSYPRAFSFVFLMTLVCDTVNPRTHKATAGKFCESEANLVFAVSSRPAKVIQ